MNINPFSNLLGNIDSINNKININKINDIDIDKMKKDVILKVFTVANKTGDKVEGLMLDVVSTFPNPQNIPLTIALNVLKNVAIFPLETSRLIANDVHSLLGPLLLFGMRLK